MPADATALVLQQALAYVLLPIWMAAGFGDWLCHRGQHIEDNAGLPESLLHWLMIAELGVGIGAAVLLEVNAAVLVLLLVVCVAHEATIWRDLLYAADRRTIPVAEQWVHGVQTMAPWVGLAALTVIDHGQALAIVGWGSEAADWGLRLRDPLPPWPALLAGMAGATLLVGLPFAEESWRCLRARQPSR